MATDLLPFVSLVTNLRCNLLPNVNNRQFFFQPYNDGKLKGYTLQCCPKRMVFSYKHCKCLPPFTGERRRPVNTGNTRPLKSKVSHDATPDVYKNSYQQIKSKTTLPDKRLRGSYPASYLHRLAVQRYWQRVHNSNRHPAYEKNKNTRMNKVKSKGRKIYINELKNTNKKLKQKFRFFKSRNSLKSRNNKPKLFNNLRQPFLPISSIDSKFSLDRQQIDFVRRNVETRLSNQPFGDNNQFRRPNQRNFQVTLPVGNSETNVQDNASNFDLSHDNNRFGNVVEVTTENVSVQDRLNDVILNDHNFFRDNTPQESVRHDLGLISELGTDTTHSHVNVNGGHNINDAVNFVDQITGDGVNSLGILGIDSSVTNTGDINTPISIIGIQPTGPGSGSDNLMDGSIFEIEGSAFRNNGIPTTADLGIVGESVTPFIDGSSVGIFDNSNLDGILGVITGTGIIGNDQFNPITDSMSGNVNGITGIGTNDNTITSSHEPQGITNIIRPETNIIGFKMKEFQNMKNSQNGFGTGTEIKSKGQANKQQSHVLFSGFGASENTIKNNNDISTGIEGKSRVISNTFSNINPSGILSSKVGVSLPSNTTRTTKVPATRALLKKKANAVNLPGSTDQVGEKTIVLSNTNTIPTAPLTDRMLPDFIPPQPKLPVSLEKLKLEMDNPVVAASIRKGKQELKKLEARTMIFQEPLPLDICHGCKMDGGVGYTNHPTSCDRFVVCYPTDGGAMKPVTQLCPYGLFWSQSALTCKLSKDVYCPHEICKFQSDKYQYASKRNCRSFWECHDRQPVPKCCPWGSSFLDGVGCIDDPSCEIPDVACSVNPNDYVLEWGGVCDKRPVVGKKGEYERRLGSSWLKEKCPTGWIYQIELCECTRITDLEPATYSFEGHTCVPEVYLPFNTDFSDYSGNNVYIRVDNASLTSGAACFDGNSAIAIPAFANMDYGDTFYLHVRYKQRDPGNDLQTLVFNGDCEKRHTFMLGTKSTGNYLSLLSNLNEEKKLWVNSKKHITDWRDIWVKFERGELTLQSNDNTKMRSLKGGIARSECGMKVGWGKGFTNFIGCIDEVSIHRCQPRNNI